MKILAFISVLALALNAFAEKPTTPEKIDGIKVVSFDEMKNLVEKDKAVLIDTRKKLEYAEMHIKGAKMVYYKEYTSKSADFMKEDKFAKEKDKFMKTMAKEGFTDKAKKYITYCNGPKCWKSFKAAKLLVKEGYKNVYWYRTGFPEARTKKYTNKN